MILSDCSSNPGLQEQENEPGVFVHSCEHGEKRHSSMSEKKIITQSSVIKPSEVPNDSSFARRFSLKTGSY